MKMKKWIRGLLSLALCASVINAFGGSTVTVYAEEGDAEGIVANKTAKVNEDGSYTISLDAYVEGEVTQVSKKVDVVLIVDVSNSMAWKPGDPTNAATYNETKLHAAMQAADTLSDIILKNDDGTETGNSLSFVTFAGYDAQHHNGTYNYFDSVQTVFRNVTNTNTAKNAFDSVRILYDDDSGTDYSISYNNWVTTRENLGGTNYDYAFNEAKGAVNYVRQQHAQDYADDKRETFVIFMTDGAPDMYNNYAAKTPSQPNRNTRIDNGQTYGMPDGYISTRDNWYQYITTHANPYALDIYDIISEGGNDDAGKMFAIGFDLENGGFNQWTFNGLSTFLEFMLYNANNGNSDGNKKRIPVETATTAEELEDIFESLAEDIGRAAIDLDSTAVMEDIVSKSFTLPADVTVDKIKVQIIPWDTSTHAWSETVKYDIDGTDGKGTWENNNNENVVVEIDGDTVDITGFDYAKHCKSDATPQQDATVNANAAKIVVSFDIYAKPESITGATEQTNDEGSGIYDKNDNCLFHFKRPNVEYASKTYVIDYAKTTTLDYSEILKSVTRIDDPSDDVLRGEEVAPASDATDDHFAFTEYTTDYGFVKYTDIHTGNDQDTRKFLVEYTPRTTKWDGYDKLFIMGEPTADYTVDEPDSIFQGNVWSLMTVVPANNVYYEDSFITTTGSGEEGSGTVGITYTGTGAWTVDGTTKEDVVENANGEVMGWEETLAEDTQYSEGSAHKANGSGTATFSFTGTGVDVYSRTNNSTGTIMVQLSGTPDGSDTAVKKNYIISNKAANGDYYQIPTFTVDNLAYGTYTVKITVTKADKNRLEYYIDGIRVYNPIKPKESEDLVKEAYVNELNAVFTEAKALMQADESGKKIAYMDENAAADGQDGEWDYGDTEVGRYAPEHEIYIASGSSVVIGAGDSDKNYYIGLKAPEGTTTVEMTEGSVRTTKEIAHTTDLYYKVIPGPDGTITIKNAGSNLLSLTKIRTTDAAGRGVSPEAVTFSNVDSSRAVSALALFATMEYADYESDVLTPEEAEIVEPAEPEEVVEVPEETEPEVEIIELGEEAVEISVAEPEPVVEEKPAAENKSSSILKQWYQSLFSAISRLFR